MNKKIVSFALFSLLVSAGLTGFVPVASGHLAPFPSLYDPTHLIVDTIAEPETLNPSQAYDAASEDLIRNVYETLIGFNPLFDIGPYQPSTGPQRTAEFLPKLSTVVPSVGNGYITLYDPSDPPINPKGGLPIYSRVTFSIQTGVSFHPWLDNDGTWHSADPLGLEDIKYSLQRLLRPTVIIDPGHGGEFLGASQADGNGNVYYEKTINLYIAQLLASALSDRYDVVMTRTGDTRVNKNGIDLDGVNGFDKVDDNIARRNIANGVSGAVRSVFVSIHANAGQLSSDHTSHGTETFYYKNEKGAYLATLVQGLLQGYLGTEAFPSGESGVYENDYTVIKKNKMPSILAEIAFLTNTLDVYPSGLWDGSKNEFAMLTNPFSWAKAAQAIADAIDIYFASDPGLDPSWMLSEALLGSYRPDFTNPNWSLQIDGAIECDSTHVWFNLAKIYPELQFMQILSQPWASIVHKVRYDPEISPLYMSEDWMCGTGPYKLDYWTHGVAWSIVKFDDYWAGWPAEVPGSTTGLPGYLSRVTWNLYTSWSTRLSRFLAGQSDMTYVPRQFRSQVQYDPISESPKVGDEPLRCFYPLQALALDAFFFTFYISPTSIYAGDIKPSGTFGTDGIPLDIFSDINMRKGFAYAFNYDQYISDIYLGEAVQPSDPVITGLAYDNPTQQKYDYDLTLAAQCLQAAWDGALWNSGMKFTIVFNTGNLARYEAAQRLADSINSLNPTKFFLDTIGVDWGSDFLSQMANGELPIYVNGWQADFTDLHNFAFPFMHSQGAFASSQLYENPFVDALIDQGTLIPDLPWEDVKTNPSYTALEDRDESGGLSVGDWIEVGGVLPWYEVTATTPDLIARLERQRIYYELQEIYVEEVPSVSLVASAGRHWEQAWMRGWYYNVLYGGSATLGIDSTAPSSAIYAYHLWKARTHFGDVDWSGSVSVADIAALSVHWTSPAGLGGYNPRADINGGTGGTTGSFSGPVDGIPDGSVNMADKSLLSAYWDLPPGPRHP